MKIQTLLLIAVIFLFSACTESYEGDQQTPSDIAMPRVAYAGKISSISGSPLSGVLVTLRQQQQSVSSSEDGSFSFPNNISTNDMLILQKEGYYTGIFTYKLSETMQTTFRLKPKVDDSVRLLFTGDLSFARRFMDPASPDRTTKLITHDVAGATMKVSDLHGSGQVIINPTRPLFHSVDFPTVNFESIATRSQYTLDQIHPTKDFAYYTDDLSLSLLKDMNVRFVTLGNNHVYDYNSVGLSDTLNALDRNSIAHSGAGMGVNEAFIPYRTYVKNLPLSFIGATSIRGDKHSLLYVAHNQDTQTNDPFATQGGAADAHDKARVDATIKQEKALGYLPIYQFHGGIEYTHAPNSVALRLMNNAIDSGASLVVSHHPHTAQGYGIKDGVFMAYGMGNYIFDQDRLDTLLSHILVCDINQNRVTSATGYPIYVEDYIPKLLTGDLANRFIRHISEASRNGSRLLEAKLGSNTMVFPHHYQEYISLDGKYTAQGQTIQKDITISDSGYAIVDLRHDLPSDYSLSSIKSTSQDLSITIGRDLLWFGSFEDDDIDEVSYENSIWNFSKAVATSAMSYRGVASAHIKRDESQSSTALLYFGRRIRTIGDARNQPNKNLSFLGYFKGVDSRPFTIESKYYASIGELEFGSTLLHSSEGGSFEWKQIEMNIPMPADTVIANDPPTYLSQNARATKFYIRMQDTHKNDANLYVDELAIINWEEQHKTNKPINLSTPHAREFLKVKGSKGEHRLTLTFTKYSPS